MITKTKNFFNEVKVELQKAAGTSRFSISFS